MVDHPGCSLDDTKELLSFIKKNLHFQPEQVQVFTPTPSTYSTLMYYTQQDLAGSEIFVEKDRNARMKQKLTITQGFSKKSFPEFRNGKPNFKKRYRTHFSKKKR